MQLGMGDRAEVTHFERRLMWAWVKIKPPGIGPQVFFVVSIYQGSILGTYF